MLTTLLTGLLGCVPKYSELPALAPAGLEAPLPVQTVEVNGVEVAYVDSGGDGPPLVFIHGLSSYMGFWEYQLPELARDYRVLALDLPGFGASARPDAPCTPPWYAEVVSDWMHAVGVPEAVLVGHSMGGQIALTMALDHPERVRGLVLSAPAGVETFSRGAGDWMKDYWHEERALESNEAAVRASMQLVFNNHDEGVERLIEERVRLGMDPAFRGTSVAVSRSIAGMIDHPVAHRLDDITAPTLFIFGSDDRLIPNAIFNGGRTRAVAEAGRDAVPGAELVLLKGAGHTVHHDDPAGFNAAALAFLSKL